MITKQDLTLNPHNIHRPFGAMLADSNVKFSAYLPDYALLFAWYGGEYIDIGYVSSDASEYEQEWHVTDVINTFDYAAGESSIVTADDFLAEIVEWFSYQEC